MLSKQKNIVHRLAIAATCVLSVTTASYGQILYPDRPANRPLILLEEQYQQNEYAVAAQSARQYLHLHTNGAADMKATDAVKAEYYLSLSCLKMGSPGCVDTAIDVLGHISNTTYRNRISFALAQYFFQHNQLVEAISYYEAAGISNLSNKEIIDEKFELAYCYFNNRQFEKAQPLFESMKELADGKYYYAGNYYYGLLAYNENNYKDALQSFERIQDNREYKDIVPYYIAEIYYYMGNRKKALEDAERLIRRKDKLFYDNELHLLAAQCLFEDQRYGDALPYFESFYENTAKVRKEDVYEMAYCYYRVNEWQNAIDKFKLLSNTRDSLGQTSMYLLGDCYLKISDKQSARNAFGICSDMSFNPAQQEASMMLDAKLSYEMGYNDEAVRQLSALLTGFPNSGYRDEAKTLLSELLIKTNNYTQAIAQINEVGTKDDAYWRVYQKAAFGYAVQQFDKGDLDMAEDYFTRSLQRPIDVDYEAAAYFWKGELAYRMHKYAETISFSNEFLNKKTEKDDLRRVSPQATQQHAYLNMGYAAMENKNYTEAQNYFSHAQQADDKTSGNIAVLREADAVFMMKNYPRAISLYDKIIAVEGDDADYARYQKSILLGLEGKTNDEITMLHYLIDKKPASAYQGYALYELALAYIETNKYPEAINALLPLTDSTSERSFAPKAWLKIGFIHQQQGDNEKAIDAYKHVVVGYPASDERPVALDALKSLYIQNNQPAAYTKLLKDNNLPSADSSAIDSTYYSAAETQYANGKWDNAQLALTNYLKQYPSGIFAIKAHYYRAESNYQLKNYKDALSDYSIVLSNGWNDFSENSANRAATISYNDKDYGSAITYYSKLRDNTTSKPLQQVAYSGLIKSSFNAGKYTDVTMYADSLFMSPSVPADLMNEAQLYKARSLQHTDKADDALAIYTQLTDNKSGELAAEAHYHIAEIYLQQNKTKEAETAANETIKQSAGYDYWIVSSYILLSDVLVKEKDYFNAKATLQSVIKHTKIEELKATATKKLEEVKELEKQHSKLSEE